MKALQTPQAHDDYRRANQAMQRKAQNDYTFKSVEAALEWYLRMRERQQSPHNAHPKGTPHIDYQTGIVEQVFIQVEGGQGGDLDGCQATLMDIQRALDGLKRDLPRPYSVLEATLKSAKSHRDIGLDFKLSPATISAEYGKAIAYLSGSLRQAEILC